MKIAILSNISSNVYALEEVLINATNKKVDAIVNLGDSFYGNIEPRFTYELMRQSAFINLCGDTDRKLLEASIDQLENNPTLNFSYNNLGEDVLYWIQDLPFEKLIGEDFYMIHGTYFDDTDYLIDDESGKQRDDDTILKLIDGIKSKFIFCSNHPKPRCIGISSGQVIINPGYVSKVFDDGSICEKASYAILTIENGEFEVRFHEVSYDYKKALESININKKIKN